MPLLTYILYWQIIASNSLGYATQPSSFLPSTATIGNGVNNIVSTGSVPSMPINFRLLIATSSLIQLVWNNGDTGSGPIKSNIVYIESAGTATIVPSLSLPGSLTTTTFPVSLVGGFYRFRVASTSYFGQGDFSISLYVQSSVPPFANAPGPIANVTCLEVDVEVCHSVCIVL